MEINTNIFTMAPAKKKSYKKEAKREIENSN